MTNRNYRSRSSRRRDRPAQPTNLKKEHILVTAPRHTSDLPAYQSTLASGNENLGSGSDEKLSTLSFPALSSTPTPTFSQLRQPNNSRKGSSRKGNSHRKQKRMLLLTTTYLSVLVISVFVISGRLYDWSRAQVIANSPLTFLETPIQAAVELVSSDSASTVLASANNFVQNTFVRNTYSGLGVGNDGSAGAIRPINILLLGTDARPSEGDSARTDSIILLSINPETHVVGMISVPRDLWVPIPHYDLTTKINLAYIIGEEENYPGGGPQLAMDTVSTFIGRPIDYYGRINFDGFIKIIDQIGGIDIVVPKTIHDEEYPTEDYGVETFHLDAGLQHLDGETALKYARTRNNDDDYERARRQQLVIQASIDRVMSKGMLPSLLPKIPSFIKTLRSSIDTNMRTSMIYDLAQDTREGSLTIVRQLVLDRSYGKETYSEEGAWILLPDREKTRVALEDFFSVVQSPPTDGIIRSRTDDANWVRVEVLNGTGQPRVAALTRERLQEKGWHVVSIDDADRSDYTNTLIVNYGAETELVDEIGDTLGLSDLPSLRLGSLKNSKTTPIDVRIVVGRDILAVLQ